MKFHLHPWLATVCVTGALGSAHAAVNCSTWKNQTLSFAGSGSTAGTSVSAFIKEAVRQNPTDEIPVTHCMLRGTATAMNSAGVKEADGDIHFELRLPETWNTKFFFHGGFGADGIVDPARGALGGRLPVSDNALSRQFAVVSMDSGHQFFGDLWSSISYGSYTVFGLDPVKRTNYAYKAIGTMTDAAKGLINLHYGSAPTKSYFVGCSNGGRQGFMAATRFPDKFEGVLAGAPALSIAKMVQQSAWDAQQMSKVASIPSAALTRDDMTVVANKVRAICDGLDDANDGMVADVARCQTKLAETGFPNNIACQGGTTSNCVPKARLDVLAAMMGGPRNAAGPLYTNWPWDPGMSSTDDVSSWRTWRMASDLGLGFPFATWVGGGMLAQVANNNPPANFNPTAQGAWDYLKAYDLNQVNERMALPRPDLGYLESPYAQLNVPNPTNLAAFRNRGGRLIVYIGSADPAISPNEITTWYQNLMAQDPSYHQFSRLYVVPGMNHCAGGPAADKFDLFKPLDDWTTGTGTWASSPDAAPIIASVRTDNDSITPGMFWSADRKRPLCKYPKVARYTGDKFFTNFVNPNNYTCQ